MVNEIYTDEEKFAQEDALMLTIKQIIKKHPNDSDLGKEIRRLFTLNYTNKNEQSN